jgi:hypothetical protein
MIPRLPQIAGAYFAQPYTNVRNLTCLPVARFSGKGKWALKAGRGRSLFRRSQWAVHRGASRLFYFPLTTFSRSVSDLFFW